MDRISISRRGLLKAGAGAAALTAARAVPPAWAQETRLRMYWWGTKERADRTVAVNKLYMASHPGVSIDGETLSFNDYWPRLATQAAGRNVPDIIQMDYRYIVEYSARGNLLALDEFMGKALTVADFGQSLDGGKVDGKLYGINLGNNSTACMYDQTVIGALGVKPPSHETSWADLASLATEITKASKKEGYWGVQDAGGVEPGMEIFMRQRGKALYTDDGKIGYQPEDVADWFGYWADMRQRGACPPAEVQALDKGGLDNHMLTFGKVAIGYAHSNQLTGLQVLNKNKLGLTMYPNGGKGAKPGQYLKPSQLWSVYARTKNPEEAAKIVNYFVEDIEACKILGTERGVPASPRIRDALAPALSDLDKTVVEYISFIADRVGKLPISPPKGAGEIELLLVKYNQQVGFKQASAGEAAKAFHAEASSALARG
jgi:multiple sugar transport system substrate-binding protein